MSDEQIEIGDDQLPDSTLLPLREGNVSLVESQQLQEPLQLPDELQDGEHASSKHR